MKPIYAPVKVGKQKSANPYLRSEFRRKAMATFEERLATYTAALRPDDPQPLWAKLSYPTIYDAFFAFFQYEYNSMNLTLISDSLHIDRSFLMRRLKEWAVKPLERRKHLTEEGSLSIPYLNDLIALCTSLYGFNMGLRKVKLECSTGNVPQLPDASEQPSVMPEEREALQHHRLYTKGDPPEHTAAFIVKFKGCFTYDDFQDQYPYNATAILVLRDLAQKPVPDQEDNSFYSHFK